MTHTIRVDLHCHSSASDGDLSSQQVAEVMAAAGVCYAALTDHDTTAGQERFRLTLEKHGIQSITGVELEVQSPYGVQHLLAYGFDLENQAFAQALHSIRNPLWSAARHWLQRIFHSKSNRRKEADPDSPAGDIVGAAPIVDGRLGIADAINLIHQAGGCAFLAHPLTGVASQEHLEAFLDWVGPQDLDGIEAFYKPYPEESRQILLAIAEKRHLLVSAGSDFHGLHYPAGDSAGISIPELYWRHFKEAVV